MIAAAVILEVLDLGLEVVLGLRGQVRKGGVGTDAVIAVAHAAGVGDDVRFVQGCCSCRRAGSHQEQAGHAQRCNQSHGARIPSL